MEGEKSNYFERVSPAQHYICAGLGAAAAGYGIYAYWGPYKWIAELELRLFHVYEIKLTLLFSFLLIYLPTVLLLAAMAGPKSDSGLPPLPEAVAAKSPGMVRLRSFFESAGYLAFIAVMFSGIGIFQFFTAMNIGDLTRVDLIKLESGVEKAPPGRWWETTGQLLLSEAQVWKEKHTNVYYIPLVSQAWIEGKAIRLVVLVRGTDYQKLGKKVSSLKGLIDMGGLPGQVVEHWNSSLAPLGSETALLVFDDGPEKRLGLAKFFSAAGVVSFVLLGIMHAYRKWRRPA